MGKLYQQTYGKAIGWRRAAAEAEISKLARQPATDCKSSIGVAGDGSASTQSSVADQRPVPGRPRQHFPERRDRLPTLFKGEWK